jgi:hypothetical protein
MPETKYKPGPVPKEAVDFFRSKGWKVGFDYRDVWKEEHALAFTVAKAMQVDVLESIRGAVDSAIAEGKTFREFQKELTPTLQKLGWWGKKEMVDPKGAGQASPVQLGSARRLRTIYRQNLRSAQAAGQWERIERTKKALPYLRYRLGPSEKHRPEHVAWEGLVLSAEDAFWDTHMPPNGWGCKCWVQQLTKFAADKLGGPAEAPKVKKREWINPRTGKTEMVPEGVTPGFDFNPGKVRTAKQMEWFNDRLNGISPTAADAVHRTWMQPEFFKQWRAKPQGNIPVAVLDDEAQAALGAKQKTVLLSDYTMNKQEGRRPVMKNGMPTASKGHPELTDAEYALLPDVIQKGRVIQAGDAKAVFFHQDGRLYKAVVKTTQTGGENFVDSFHRASEGQIRRELKKKGAVEIRAEKK